MKEYYGLMIFFGIAFIVMFAPMLQKAYELQEKAKSVDSPEWLQNIIDDQIVTGWIFIGILSMMVSLGALGSFMIYREEHVIEG